MEHENSIHVLSSFLKEINVQVTLKSIKEEISKHPHPKSILAISDLLNNWKVKNIVLNIAIDEILQYSNSAPFIAFLSNGQFIVVNGIDKNNIVVSNKTGEKSKLDISSFQESYAGICLFAEKSENSGESNYAKKKKSDTLSTIRLPILASLTFLILIYYLVQLTLSYNIHWLIQPLIFIKFLGLLISFLLIYHTIDSNNPFIKKLCGTNNKTNCNAVLSSKYAKIGNALSLSEIVFFYFSGSLLALSLFPNNNFVLSVTGVLGCMAFIFTLPSVFIQWKIIKKWCLLCLSVSSIIWIEVILYSQIQVFSFNAWSSKLIIELLICFILPITIWSLIKPLLIANFYKANLNHKLNKFKFNELNFRNYLFDENNQRISPISDDKCIILGNKTAETEITLISNPNCGLCASFHSMFKTILTDNDNIKLKIVFRSKDSKTDHSSLAIRHILKLKEIGTYDMTEVLYDLYSINDYSKFAKKYTVSNLANHELVDEQNDWCNLNDIHYTPTVFINQALLPEDYSPIDLKYLI